MAQPNREFHKGGIWHIVNRGVMKMDIFQEKEDYAYFLYRIKESLKKYPIKIHSFNFISNHLHYLIEQISEKFPPSNFLASIHTGLGVFINKKYKRVGHLFQNRCTIKLIENDEHLLKVSFYINLNEVLEKLQHADRKRPVSAVEVNQLIDKACKNPWSSFPVLCGLRDDGITNPDFILSLLSDDKVKAQKEYKELAKQFLISGHFLKTRDLTFEE